LSAACLTCGWVDWPLVTDDDNIGTLAEQPNQRFAQKTILHYQKYSDCGTRDDFAYRIHCLLGFLRFDMRASHTQK
jgi:hypothetical protein